MLPPQDADRLRVVLVATRNPLNIGAAARAMSNFGFLRLRVVRPFDMAFREARSAVGAPGLLHDAEVCANIAEAVHDCSLVVGTTAAGSRELDHPLRRIDEAGELIRTHLATQPAAILFGSEKHGLSNEDLSHCHWLTRIPTREQHDSMNLGQAVAITLYELASREATPQQTPVPAIAAETKATGQELQRLEETLLTALEQSGYTKPGTQVATEEKARRLIRRMNLGQQDAVTLTGMLAKMKRNRNE